MLKIKINEQASKIAFEILNAQNKKKYKSIMQENILTFFYFLSLHLIVAFSQMHREAAYAQYAPRNNSDE